MRSHAQALIVITISFGALIGVLAASGEAGTNCGCLAPIGFPPACLAGPCPAHEMLMMESYKVNSPTNVTLTILNSSPLGIGFSNYTVKQPNGAEYTHSNWTEPILAPNQELAANILISSAPFTFQSGSSYTITIVTLRYNPFQFSIKA